MKKSTVIILAAVAAVIGFAVFRRMNQSKPFAAGQSLPVVETVNPVYGKISNETALIGTIMPSDSVAVTAKAGGDVTGVFVKAGDTVNAGDLICTIDTKQVSSAKTTLDNARLSLKSAQDTLSREKLLYDAGDLSQQDYDNYVNQAEKAKVSFESAQTAYQTQMDYANVRAKISGVVEQCSIEVNDSLNAGASICVITGAGAREVHFSVTERIRGALAVGDELKVQKNDDTYTANITEVSTMANSSTGLYEIKAAFNETSGDVSAFSNGSMAKIRVVSSHADNVMILPKDCIYSESAGDFVYTVTDHVLKKVQVKTGMEDPENIEITDGLTTDDVVCSTWSSELDDGTKVRLKGESTETSPEAASGPEGMSGAPAGRP